MRQSETFDRVAELYDAARPSYPAALFQALADAAGLAPGDPVLEVGCGTGKATAGLLTLGLAVTALDPGENLIQQAKRRFGEAEGLLFVTEPFERWAAPRPGLSPRRLGSGLALDSPGGVVPKSRRRARAGRRPCCVRQLPLRPAARGG